MIVVPSPPDSFDKIKVIANHIQNELELKTAVIMWWSLLERFEVDPLDGNVESALDEVAAQLFRRLDDES